MVKLILETGSLYQTALRLNCAQSVVSRQLASLEYECGGRLFHRNARGVRLTELGEQLMPHVETIIEAAQEMIGSGKRQVIEPDEEVKIAVGPQIASYLSGPLVSEMKRIHPNIRLTIGDAVSDNIRTDLKEGRTDLAIFMRSGRALGHDDREIGSGDTYLVGLPTSEATARDTIPFSSLAGLPLLLPSQHTEWRRSLDATAARKRVNLTVVAEANTPGSRAAMVQDGVGYLILPMLAGNAAARLGWIAGDVHAERLRASRIVEPAIPIKLVVSIGSNRRRAVDLVADVVDRMLRELIKDPAVADQGQ
ncbi:MAG: LysR family transcriptional regulator [Sphingomonas sp.]|uniref:LysR family transcriptional regulator n=1 Tax=Sphingomonas sp. TaxID=28214 RepID=UPI0025DBC6B0|nr:LysR family transcriptional regulator [Sphingomonas sp.]MBX3564157.1 LysR family transcriptional regulator [Sphingomonas sp.]